MSKESKNVNKKIKIDYVLIYYFSCKMSEIPSYRHILETFITQSDGKQIISHQIESFNQFMEVDIPEIIHMANPITSYGSPEIPLAGPRSALATATGLSTTAANALMGTSADGSSSLNKKVQHEYEVTLEFEKISIRKPTIFENNGAIHPMMPNDARLRNLTYASPLTVDVKVTTNFIDHTRNSIRESNVRIFPNVHFGKIPVMVGSKYCLLNDQKHIHPSKLGECTEDVGGYFIIQGGERVMISMERMSENRPFVFRNGRGNSKEKEVVEIKCIGPDNDQVPKSNTIKIVYHPKNQLITMLRATVPRIKTEIPIIILFRALGVLADKDIYELIIGCENDPTYDHIIIESILEASSITTQELALNWLIDHTNSWSVKTQKQNNVRDILSEELFPQIGGSEMNYEKACFLAHMTRKALWTSTQRIPTDDRDAYPNKRVDIPGFLLADLFRKTYNNRMVKDMKGALSKEIHGGSWKATGNWTEIVNINNINKIIKSTILDVCLKSSLATGKFGSGKIGGPSKDGVSQVLNRLNITSSISHLRRISTPIEKTGKLIAPRKQHNTQWGYICVKSDTAILDGNGITSTPIIKLKDGDIVRTVDPNTLEETPSSIHHYFKTTPKSVLEIKTLSGRSIGCSPDHPLLVVRGGLNEWVHAGDLVVGDKVVVKNYTVPLPDNDGIEVGAELIGYSEKKKQIIARLLGASLSTIAYLEKVDAEAIALDIEELGLPKPNIYYFKPYYRLDFPQFSSKYHILFNHEETIPSWILNGSSSVKREFVSAFLSVGFYLKQIQDVVKMLNQLGINAYIDDNQIHYQTTFEEIAKYASVIGYRYCARKSRENALSIEYAMYRGINSTLSLDEFSQMTAQIDDKIIIPITEIKDVAIEDVYDFTTESDNHDFYANGILVRNCPCETPEGHGVGVIKNMASTVSITIFSSPITIYAFIQNCNKLVSLRDATIQQKHENARVFLNGSWIGMLLINDAPEMIDALRKAKRAGKIHINTGIIWKNHFKELWITTEAGRVIRPVYYAPAIREIAADKTGTLKQQILEITEWNKLLMWESPTEKHLFEYIDAGETEGSYIAMDYESCIKDTSYTHCEIHPSVIFGTAASGIPFPDHNQSPRNAYQCAMGKQAMGVYALNFRERFDAMSHVLCYPEIPMVSPYMSKFYGAQSLPAGQNIVVAIMTYTGYNQEDSNMINRAALDRGRFRSIFYRTYKDEERKNQSSGEEEKFCTPDPTETKHMKNAHYEKVAEDGFVPKDTYVTPDDILIGKVVPLRVPTGAILPAGAKKQRDVSKLPRNNESGYVDKVYKNRNGEGYSFVKIRMRQDRIPEIGDKFSCYSPDTDILTERGWVPFPELTSDDKVATLINETTMAYTKPLEIMSYDYKGKMYKVESNQVDLLVTPNHRMYVGNRTGENFGFKLAEECYGKRWTYKKNIENYIPSDKHPLLSYVHNGEEMKEPQGFILKGDEKTDDLIIPINDWLMLFGIWIAEGCTLRSWGVSFATHKQRVKDVLEPLCARIGFEIRKHKDDVNDTIRNAWCMIDRPFVNYIKPLSVGAVNKSLPAWTLSLTPEQCRILINGMMLGDGHTMANGTRRYDTSSVQLANDFQRLCLHAGYSTNISLKYAAGHEAIVKKAGREGEVIRSTADAFRLTIIEKQNRPLVNKNITSKGENRHDSWEEYDGKVYCCKVEGPGAIYVRRNKMPVWSGNSRHGQKGTMGMILNPEDMPQTASGIVPDIIINPHAIPSRMTIAQLMETLLSKIGCMTGCLGDGSPFNATTVEDLSTILRDTYGMEPYGNEIMYNGYTGRMMETSIFIGPCYYQRLRHCAADKLHSRASGPLVMLTRQPAEGRARDGGLRFGEMERDCVVAHGMAEFTKERLMECSDAFSCYTCKDCGLLAIANPEQSIWACRGCGNTTNFSHVNIPYATKLLLQELETMSIGSRLITQHKLITHSKS